MSEPPSSRDAVGTRKGPFRFPGFPAGPFQPSLVGLAAALLVSCGGQAGWMSFNDGYAETGPLGVGVSVTGVVRSADTARHDETRLGDATFARFGVFAGGAAPDYWLWPRDEGVALEVQFAGYVDDEGFPSEYWRLAFPMVSLGERRPGMPGAASKGWTGRSHGALVGLGVTYVRKHGGADVFAVGPGFAGGWTLAGSKNLGLALVGAVEVDLGIQLNTENRHKLWATGGVSLWLMATTRGHVPFNRREGTSGIPAPAVGPEEP